MKHVSPQTGVVLRRAANLFTERKYYRQIRSYKIGDNSETILSKRSKGDIEFTFMQKDTEAAISDIKTSRQINIPARIERLEELLEKIDDYMLRIKGFQELAKRNLSSSNVLTIEAPPGYRVNLNRLKKWSLLIDPASDNDPYAQRVLAVAKCDECFLEKKRAEFTNRIEELKTDQDNELTDEIIKLEDHLRSLKKRRNALSESDDVVSLSKLVVEENSKFIMKNVPETFSDPESFSETTAFGCRSIPFNIGEGDPKAVIQQYVRTTKSALQRLFRGTCPFNHLRTFFA